MDAREEVKGWSQALARHKIWLELSWALDINYADYWKSVRERLAGRMGRRVLLPG